MAKNALSYPQIIQANVNKHACRTLYDSQGDRLTIKVDADFLGLEGL
ncbi:hypothetical protein NX027_12865 [Escherichia coli]|nr:hypothetical protein [Escherichia coli]